jgi:hypothetical protein
MSIHYVDYAFTTFLKKKVPFALLYFENKNKWKGINNGSCR